MTNEDPAGTCVRDKEASVMTDHPIDGIPRARLKPDRRKTPREPLLEARREGLDPADLLPHLVYESISQVVGVGPHDKAKKAKKEGGL